MKTKKIEKESVYKGELPKGCQHCARGSKMVLLVTGKCRGDCWYCPLSEEKKGKNVIYADEKKIDGIEDILEEARFIRATGTGITGGDPLLAEKTFDLIRILKSEFGEKHHVHLYTQTTEIDLIKRAYDQGLDEIRFHPPVERWGNIQTTDYSLLLDEIKEDMDLDIGLEIPSIPGKKEETIKLLKELGELVDFINLNELEFSSTNTEELMKRDYKHKSDISSAVEGSQDLAQTLLNRDFGTSVHYCSLSFKDGVQLTNRLKRRAETVAKEGDMITDEGTLVRGMIKTKKGEGLTEDLRDRYRVPEEILWYIEKEERIECSLGFLKEIRDDLEEDCYGIEIYPTSDRLEVERWPLD